MKHRDLNAPPDRQMADIVRSLKERAESSKTTAHGVKDMGPTGDSTWTTPEGEFKSVRRFAVQLDDTAERAEQLEEDLRSARESLGVARARLLALSERPLQPDHELPDPPTAESGTGVEVGEIGAVRDAAGEPVSWWQWDGATWRQVEFFDTLVARIAQIMELSVGSLVVTEGATIDHLVALAIAGATAEFQEAFIQNLRTNGAQIDEAVIGDLAANLITSGLFRTAAEGQRLEIDSNGLIMWGTDPDGNDYEMVRIGPNGENLLTVGDTTIAPDSVASPRGAFGALEVGGEALTDLLAAMPRGRVAQNRYVVNSSYSDRAQSRLSTQFTVMPGRRYRIEVSPFYLQANSQTTDVEYRLLYAWDSLTTTWDGPGVAQGRSPLGNLNPLLVPGLVADLPTSNDAAPRDLFLTLMVRPARDAVRVVARGDYPLTITVDDVGARNGDVGSHWTVGNVTEGTTTPPPATPTIQEKSYTWSAAGYGGDVSAGQIVQGTYPSVGERWGGWTFPSGMLSTLRAAKSIKRFEVYLYAEHWYYGAGGTAVLRPNDGSYKGTAFGGTAIESAKWPPRQGRWVTVPSSWHSALMSNTYKGISVRQSSSSLVQYGRFNATATRFRATYTI